MTARRAALGWVAAVLLSAAPAAAGPLDEMSVARWAKLREAERFQLNVAEKFYRESQWKVAAAEYEKFLKLYPDSEGASFAQLKWAHCQVKQRQMNTAVKDGYQSLLDYYPETPEAPIAALLIGRTYKDMGDTRQAKKAYAKAAATYPNDPSAVLARFDLIEIATKENDKPTLLTLLRQLTYDTDRKGHAADECVKAARQLARLHFQDGDFADGLKALATTCKDDDLPDHLMRADLGGLAPTLRALASSADEVAKKSVVKLADAAAGWLQQQADADLKDPAKKPRAVRCWNHVADVRFYALQPDKQKEVLEKMVSALGASDELLGRLAQWYKDAKQRDQARATFARFQNAAEGQGLIAWSWVEEGQHDKAVAIYRQLAVQDDKNAAKWLTAAASAYRHAGKSDPAIAVYRELLTADSAKANAYHWEIAETLWHAGRWKEAITAYRGTDRFPTNHQRMAHAHRQLKEYNEAIALYRQVMAAHPDHASWALLEIGRTHEQAGQTEPAIKVFKQVCSKFPKTGEGSWAHAHLNEKYKIPVTLGGDTD